MKGPQVFIASARARRVVIELSVEMSREINRGGLTLAEEAQIELSRLGASSSIRERIASLLDKLIFSSLLGLIVLTAIPYGTVQPWWEAVFECTVFALASLWIIEGWLTGTWHVNGCRLIAPLVGIIFLAFIQTISIGGASDGAVESQVWRTLSADPYETRLFIFKMLALTLSGMLLLRSLTSPRRLRALIHVIIVVGVASALFGIVRQTIHRETPGFILPDLNPRSGYGQFINRNHFAFLMEMVLGLIFGLIIGRGVRRERLLIYVAAGVLVWAALVLSNSRSGIFSMLCQVLFIALLFNTVRPYRKTLTTGHEIAHKLRRIMHARVTRVALLVCLLVVMIASMIWIGGDPLVSHIEEAIPSEIGTKNTRANVNRLEMWRATWKLIKANPIVGVGFGGYAAAIAEYHDASGELVPQQAHNDYLELLASGGPIGLALGGWFVLIFVKRARKRLRSSDPFQRAACFGASAGLFAVVIHSLFDFGLHVTANALIFTALVAMVGRHVEPISPSIENSIGRLSS